MSNILPCCAVSVVLATVATFFPLKQKLGAQLRRFLPNTIASNIARYLVMSCWGVGLACTEMTMHIVGAQGVALLTLKHFQLVDFEEFSSVSSLVVIGFCDAMLLVTYVRGIVDAISSTKNIVTGDKYSSSWFNEWLRTITIFGIFSPRNLKKETVIFCTNPKLELDIIHDRGNDRKNKPVFLYVHGGAWVRGSRHWYPPLLHDLARRGFICITVSYRLAFTEPYPAMIVDVKTAIAWIKKNISKYGGNKDQIIISGGSAGGHLASLASLSPNHPHFQPSFHDEDTSVAACVSFYGVYDIFGNNLVKRFWENVVAKKAAAHDPILFQEASPINWVGKNSVPTLLLHGSLDNLVATPSVMGYVHEFQKQNGNHLTFYNFYGAHHCFDLMPSPRSVIVSIAIHRWILSSVLATKRKQ